MLFKLILILILILDTYLIIVSFIKKDFNIKIFLLAYFFYGASIFALLTGIFRIGGIIGFIPIFMYVLININNVIKSMYSASKKIKLFFIFIFILFLFEMIWTVFSDSIQFAIKKDFLFMLYTIVAIYTFLVFKKYIDGYKFLLYLHFWITLYLFLMVIKIDFSSNMYILTNGYVGGENRIVLSRFLFIYIVSSIYLISKNYIYFLSLLPALYIYIYAAGRGPLIGFILALLFYILVNIKRLIKEKYFYIFLIIFSIGLIIFISSIDIDELSNHIMLAKRLIDSENISTSDRGQLYLNIYHHFLQIDVFEFLFGYGAGDSFYYIDFKYPHNFIIELYFELGLIGIILAFYFIYFHTSIYKNNDKDNLIYALLIIDGILFFSGMFSSSLHIMPQLPSITIILYKLFYIKSKIKMSYKKGVV